MAKGSLQEALKQKISAWIKEAQEKFFLQAWDISIVWGKEEEGEGAFMTASSNSEYREAEIEVSLKRCLEKNEEFVRRICYHEMAHVLLADFVDRAHNRYVSEEELRRLEEQLAELIARIVLN